MLTGNLDNNLSEKINDDDKKHVDRNYLWYSVTKTNNSFS